MNPIFEVKIDQRGDQWHHKAACNVKVPNNLGLD